MAEMGKYCKAYLAKDFRQFKGWTENLENLRPEDEEGHAGARRSPPARPPGGRRGGRGR